MKKINKYIITESGTTNQAIELIQHNHERVIFVVDKKSRVIGTVSEGDILRSILRNQSINIKISAIMNKSFKFLTKENKKEAKKLIKKFGITIIPVITKNFKIKTLVRLKDVI